MELSTFVVEEEVAEEVVVVEEEEEEEDVSRHAFSFWKHSMELDEEAMTEFTDSVCLSVCLFVSLCVPLFQSLYRQCWDKKTRHF